MGGMVKVVQIVDNTVCSSSKLKSRCWIVFRGAAHKCTCRPQRQPSFRIRTVNHLHLLNRVLGPHPRSRTGPFSNPIDELFKLPAVCRPRRILAIFFDIRNFGPLFYDLLIRLGSYCVIFCNVDSMPEGGDDVGPKCHCVLNGMLLLLGKGLVWKDDVSMLGGAHWCTPTWPLAGEPWERVASSHRHVC